MVWNRSTWKVHLPALKDGCCRQFGGSTLEPGRLPLVIRECIQPRPPCNGLSGGTTVPWRFMTLSELLESEYRCSMDGFRGNDSDGKSGLRSGNVGDNSSQHPERQE